MSKNILAHCVGHLYRYIFPDVFYLFYLFVLSCREEDSEISRSKNWEKKILERRLLEDMRDMKFSIVREIFFEVLSAFIVQFLFFYLSTLNISSILSLIVFSFVLISIFFLRLRNAYHNFFEIIEKD